MIAMLDLNVILDVTLKRQTFFAGSKTVWDAALADKFEGHMTATEITNLYYITRRHQDHAKAMSAVEICLANFRISVVDHAKLLSAAGMKGNDFEDNVVIACAEEIAADYIVTRDETGFAHSSVPAISPADFLSMLAQ